MPMADLSSYLRRFRRLMSPPGRPGPAAVPKDRTADVSGELADVYGAVDAIAEEARRIRRDAEDRAEQRRTEAREEAERIRTQARERAEEERATAGAEKRSDLEDELREAAAAAEEEAVQVRMRAAQRIERLADRIAEQVLTAEFGDGREEAA